ncbi:unnamed protein product [Cladocopium goreaui]|uniref:Uncharacterized protein n=1 Tax=Cladocopium goreaui TaxID=2562237 RepID=A0A9P1DUN0_9DINO|nr:unnamed protein product [Cladocopium goreaui]
MHMDKCEELGVSWPPDVPEVLENNAWLKTAPPREKEIVCLAALEKGATWVDSSQNITRARNSTKKSAPTVLPGCRLWSFQVGRYMTGRDLMRLQGYPIESLPDSAKWSDHQCADLAGNAFSSSVSCAVDVAVLLSAKRAETPPCNMMRFLDGMNEPQASEEMPEENWEFEL